MSFTRRTRSPPRTITTTFPGPPTTSGWTGWRRTSSGPPPREYGDLVITINLSKPEKDPKAIAAAKNAPQSGYPKCALCRGERRVPWQREPGRPGQPPAHPLGAGRGEVVPAVLPLRVLQRALHRHSSEHRPMKVSRESIARLLEFVTFLPHYFVGSNADLPIVGGVHPHPRPLPGGPV